MTAAAPGPAGADLEALRAGLWGHCYRLLGSGSDAEEAVQEAMLRAVARWPAFDPARGRLSTWLYAIATNVALDMLRSARRRRLVVEDPVAFDDVGSHRVLPPDAWVEPVAGPPARWGEDPAWRVEQRETVRLAFVAALQWLPPRQRAVLLLRDVLAFSAAETADVLDLTVAAANSALQRARATLTRHHGTSEPLAPPGDPHQRDLLRRYIAAFESHDLAALTALLCEDAVTSMPPVAWRVDGGAAVAGLVAHSDACAGDRLLPCTVNAGPGLGQYRPDGEGVLRPFALVALELVGGRVAQVVTFLGTGERFPEFGLPRVWPGRDPGAGDR